MIFIQVDLQHLIFALSSIQVLITNCRPLVITFVWILELSYWVTIRKYVWIKFQNTFISHTFNPYIIRITIVVKLSLFFFLDSNFRCGQRTVRIWFLIAQNKSRAILFTSFCYYCFHGINMLSMSMLNRLQQIIFFVSFLCRRQILWILMKRNLARILLNYWLKKKCTRGVWFTLKTQVFRNVSSN